MTVTGQVSRPPLGRTQWPLTFAAAGPAGSVLAYGVDTFHRAVPLRAPSGARFTMQVNFRASANEWMTRHAWGDRSFDPNWAPFVEHADPAQLSLFGFPPPGHPFWTPRTLAALRERYPNLNTSYWS